MKLSFHERADAIHLWIRNNKVIALLIALMGGVILVGNFAESLEKILRPLIHASEDASQIAKIRKDVEQMRDQVALVAREANNARADINSISTLANSTIQKTTDITRQTLEVKKIVEEADIALVKIRTTSDFSFLLARAVADDREAFDSLLIIANEPSNDFHSLALNALVKMANDLGAISAFSGSVDWKKMDIDPNEASLVELKSAFAMNPAFNQPAMLNEIWHQQRFPKYERLTFLYEILRSTKSVLVLNAACKAFNEEARIDRNIIGYQGYLDWWFKYALTYVVDNPALDPENP